MATQFKGLILWRLLRRKPYLTAQQISAEVVWPITSVSCVMQWLRENGCVQRHGIGSRPKWTATKREPTDTRGTSAGSLAVLRKNWTRDAGIDHAQRIRMEMVAAGTFRHNPSPKPVKRLARQSSLVGTPLLEQLWRPMGFSAIHTQPLVDVVELTREDAPEVNAQEAA